MTEEKKNILLNLKSDDVDATLLQKFFANTKKGPALFKPNDPFLFSYKGKTISTTVGRYFFNIFILQPDNIMENIGYQNIVLDEDGISELNRKVAEITINGKITNEQYISYLNRLFWLAYKISSFLNVSMDLNIIKPNKEVMKRKKELFKENEEKLKKGDVVTASKIEKELIDIAKDKLKNDPSYDIYASGSRGSFSNNYKNTAIMHGPIRSVADPTKYYISSDNLVDGISKDDYPYFADIAVAASHGRAINTQRGGYETKKMMSAFQSITLDEKGTDCHSTKYLEIKLTNKNKDMFLNRYINNRGKLVLLTDENIDQFVDKIIKLRSPMFCKSEHICNICAGNSYYDLDIKNIGLTLTILSGSLTNKSMKSFHDTSLKTSKINFFDYVK